MSSEQQPTGPTRDLVLVTGATGYIGGRLVPRLLDRGYRVRCLARRPEKLLSRPWATRPGLEITEGDVGDASSLLPALAGCRFAYYLVHSMLAAGPEYARRDRELATCFSTACAEAGCERIVYLGGLGETGKDLSEHLSSRREVEEALHHEGVRLTVLRAAMIIGSGSASFEIMRYLVERLPVMITPRWVSTECQPIAVRNVLQYLVAALELEGDEDRILDIGGPDVLTYREILQTTASCLGLRRRWVIPVPVLTPRLSSLWIHLVTPVSRHIARPLAEGLKNRVVCRDDEAARLMPQRLLTVREAIDEALGKLAHGATETSWVDAGPILGDPDWAGGTAFVDHREIEIRATPEEVFQAVCRIGGGNGWYAADSLWRIRGFLDRLFGGPGLRRGRRDPTTVGYGDALDFWRVTGIEQNRKLRLRAEMKLPGEALLEFEIESLDGKDSRTILVQRAWFLPRGLLGLGYWYAVLPFHHLVFRGMLEGIRGAAEQPESDS